MDEIDIAVCPFCDSNAVQTHKMSAGSLLGAEPFFFVLCAECYARGPKGVTSGAAVDYWNAGAPRARRLETSHDHPAP